MRLVQAVKALMDGQSFPSVGATGCSGRSGRNGRAGAAASEPYQRYVSEYEVRVHPRHDKLEKRFKAFLRARHPGIAFPPCYRDDLRYAVPGEAPVMVEVKPTDLLSLRYAIRTAIGQLLDYRQQQQWGGPQLILVENEVTNADDLRLAHQNGFGLAWPLGKRGFDIRWPR